MKVYSAILYRFCVYTRPRYQVNINRTIGPLVSNIFLITFVEGSLSNKEY